MVFVLIIVLIALTFGFVFARLDSLTKACKMLENDIKRIQKDIDNSNEKHR